MRNCPDIPYSDLVILGTEACGASSGEMKREVK
jgi:hypothetical protein